MTEMAQYSRMTLRTKATLSNRWRIARRFLKVPSATIGLVLLLAMVSVALLAHVIAPGAAYAPTNRALAAPSWTHLLGTDIHHSDMLKLVVDGIRTSMITVGLVVVISSGIGVSFGLVAGYAGGLIDDIINRLAELFQAVPRFFLALMVVAIYGPGLDKIVVVLSLTSWTLLARVVRAETMSIKRLPFIEAARAAGVSGSRIVRSHVLPNVLPQAIVVIVVMGSRVVLIEAGLAYLGLADPDRPSLGVLARSAQQFLRDAWWLSVFPGLAIVALVLAMNLLSDGLNQALDPEAADHAQADNLDSAIT